MRVVLGKVVDFNEKFDSSKLTPKEKLIGLTMFLTSKSHFIKANKKKEMQEQSLQWEANKKPMAKSIAAQVAFVFQKPIKNGKKVLTVSQQTLSIKKFPELLEEVVDYAELAHYDVEILKMDPDLLLSFPNMERHIRVSKKKVGE